MNLICAGSWYGAEEPFRNMFRNTIIVHNEEEIPQELTPDDVILFGGGADISPKIYHQARSQYNMADDHPSQRDKFEMALFRKGRKVGAKFLGICRGAQLLCALSGGTVIQHVTRHGGTHSMETKDGRLFSVSSAHHQMMNPFSAKEFELVGWSQEARSTCYLGEGDNDVDMPLEPEVVWFPKTKALGIQYHPEFMHNSSPGVSYSRELVDQYLFSGV